MTDRAARPVRLVWPRRRARAHGRPASGCTPVTAPRRRRRSDDGLDSSSPTCPSRPLGNDAQGRSRHLLPLPVPREAWRGLWATCRFDDLIADLTQGAWPALRSHPRRRRLRCAPCPIHSRHPRRSSRLAVTTLEFTRTETLR
jgi:hypothetical protein